MNKEALQEKIDKIRDAEGEGSITNTQVAEILTNLNEGKLETDLSNLPEEQKALLRGEQGRSAYEIWLGQGNEGTEQDFINSLKGERGERGNDGLVGVSGRDGVSVYAFKADNEEEAIALSRKYRMNIYYWT